MSGDSIYAAPKMVTRLDQCYFYHTMDIPGYGHVEGEWDLRDGAREYLGGVDLGGKRVLDVGAASGFLTFYMESQGAEVISYDLAPEHSSSLDFGPTLYGHHRYLFEYKRFLKALNNSYWLSHGAYHSGARMVHGTVYAIPEELGTVDITVFGSILLHLRDPFLAVQSALRLTRETVVIVEPLWSRKQRFLSQILPKLIGPYMVFLPKVGKNEPDMTWWFLPPCTVQRFVATLDFQTDRVIYHTQKYRQRDAALYTVVASRTRATRLLGETPTSANPGLLHARITLDELPTSLSPGQKVIVGATVQNVGDTLWLSAPRDAGGHVTFGVQLRLPDDRLLTDGLGRTLLARDVPPGEQIRIQTSFRLPGTLAPGEYVLRFDMVDELVAWFEQFGSSAIEHRFLLREMVTTPSTAEPGHSEP